MKIFQVVFLLDLDSVSQDSADDGALTLETKSLREVLLKFLTFFATEHCASDSNASFSLKWGCKYYNSSGNKNVRQRCAFQDFNLVNYEKFEDELEEKLKKCKLQPQGQQATSGRTSKPPPSFKTKIHNLELALKDLVCDYTWDQPYVCSPVRKTRRQQKSGEPRRKSNESDNSGEVENIVIVITGVPWLHTELDGLVEGKRKLTHSVLLDKILSPSLYKQFVQISKIRLFWLDASNVIRNGLDNKIESCESQVIFHLFHQALRKTGGGLIPLNAILPPRNANNDGPSTSSRQHIPEGLAFQIPVSALMTGYLLGGSEVSHQHPQVCKSSRLHLNLGIGESRPVVCDLELLPLFKSNIRYSENCALSRDKGESFRIQCTNKMAKEKKTLNDTTVEPAKHFTVTCNATNEETGLNYIPQDIRIIGTILLHKIHTQLIAKPLVYICCPADYLAAKKDSLSLQQILMELSSYQMALLVSCDELCQGIFFPSNSRCEIALLYVLASEGEASVFTLKVGPASIPKDINFLIQKSLETCTNVSAQKRIPKTYNRQESAALSPSFLEKWFIPHPSHGNTLSEVKIASPPSSLKIAQKIMFKRLQQAYIPSLMNVKQKKSPSVSSDSIPYVDHLRRSPRLQRDSQLNANVSRHKPAPQSSTILIYKNQNDNSESNGHAQGVKTNQKKRTSILSKELLTSGMCDQANENDMLTNLQEIYKNAISGDSSVLSIAQTVLDVCISFYKNQDRINAKMCTRDAIAKHFLLKPGDVECSKESKEGAKKWKIREHCFQSVIRLELMAIDPSKTDDYVSETTSHLRKLSFIAGPSILSSFLQETLVENYYTQLNEAVAEICEDLNQPLPNEDEQHSPNSSNDGLPSPEKSDSIPASMLSQMSTVSSISSSSNQSKAFKTKRSEAVTRYPSFGDVVHKRKIVISQDNSKLRSLHTTSNSGPLTRSAQKRLQEKSTGSKSASRNVCRSLFKHGIPTTRKHATPLKLQKPTTPKGRHVLRTKSVADTPVHKQVDHPTLHRQTLKRKRTLEIDSTEDEVVEESPDKQPGPSYNLRPSPKRHASALWREASFYSACPESKTEIATVGNNAASNTPLRRSARKLAQIACPEITPDRKLKAKRVLILGATPYKETSNTTPKKRFKGSFSQFCPRRSERLSGTEESPKYTRTPTQAVRAYQKDETKLTPTGSCRKSPRLSKSNLPDFKEATSNKHDAHHGMLKNPKVSRKLLQTPLKSESKPASQTTTADSVTGSMCYEDRVLSTPTRNGLDSPEASPHLVFFYGPLAGNSEYSLSRSSSPVIPLLSNEMVEFYEDQNLCASLETPVALKCDDVHTCPDTDVNFSQYFCSNDLQSSTAVLQDAVVPSEKLAVENTNFMFTPAKSYSAGISGSPECALPPWEVQNSFNGTLGFLANHSLDTQDNMQKKTGSLETIRFSSAETCSLIFDNVFSPSPSVTGENDVCRTKTSPSSSDSYSLQRFTRQASKELGISLKEFKKLTSEFGNFENGKEANQTPKKTRKPATELSKEQRANSLSPTKLSWPIVKSKFTPPTDKSLFHLTNSPILSSVSARTTRHSLKKQVRIESKDNGD